MQQRDTCKSVGICVDPHKMLLPCLHVYTCSLAVNIIEPQPKSLHLGWLKIEVMVVLYTFLLLAGLRCYCCLCCWQRQQALLQQLLHLLAERVQREAHHVEITTCYACYK